MYNEIIKKIENLCPMAVKKIIKSSESNMIVSTRTNLIINKIADRPSLYPDSKRKNRDERIADLFAWLKKYKYINDGYIEYGMDRENFDRWDEYLDHYIARIEEYKNIPFYRLKGSPALRPLYANLSDDKFLFGTYLNSILPGSTPRIYKYFLKGKLCKNEVLKDLNNLPNGKFICKPTLGQCGRDIFVIEVENGCIKSESMQNLNKLIEAVKVEPYIVQEFVYQHDDLAKLNKSSVNTIRIVTTKFNNEAHLFGALLRIGVTDSLTDNAAAGGTYVGLDYKSGCLLKYGYYHKKPRELEHPISKVVYEGYKIPYWYESVEMVKKLHKYFRQYPSIGWDVAITNNGPQIIENNYDWDFVIMQQVYGGLKKQWYAMRNMP